MHERGEPGLREQTAPLATAAAAQDEPIVTESAVVEALAETLLLVRRRQEEALAPLREKIAVLEGQFAVVLTLLGGKAGEVVDLPRLPVKGARPHVA